MGIENNKIEPINIANLEFDPENPRMPSDISGTDEHQVIDWMLDDEKIIDLMSSIGEQDYFEGEPILVVEKKKEPGKFTVIEGNRRLAAVKLLANPDLATIRKKAVQNVCENATYIPVEIPAVKYEEREDVLDYLGYRHITGIRPWEPKAKARYLEQLYRGVQGEDDDEKFRDLARTIGSTSNYVGRMITGLNIYNLIESKDFFNISGLNERTFEFTLLTTALNYNTIVSYIGLTDAKSPSLDGIEESELMTLTNWIFERDERGKKKWIGESRELRELAAIVDNKKALQAFLDGASLEDALIYTNIPLKVFRESILEARAQLKIANSYLYSVTNPSETDLDNLNAIIKMADDLVTNVKKRIEEIEGDEQDG